MEIIGPYQIIRTIGKGGMGEVFLAYDPIFKREVALKRIRKDLKNYEILKERFLKEARITGQFSHPNIISIYSLHQDSDQTYYTMPYVEGNTLKQILRQAHENTRNGNSQSDTKHSIPPLMRIFFSVCQAVSYAHSKSTLHRDLKPENILVGTYGEVVILDWGLAQSVHDLAQESNWEEDEIDIQLTQPGKLVGTLAYMAPERAYDNKPSFQTDIYALGVILYQILTLHLPFQRTTLKEFRKNFQSEKLPEPEDLAPYRDVPPRLSRLVKKCLDLTPTQRYQTVSEIICDLTSYLEGRSDWFQITEVDIHNKSHWEFHENVLISRHIAITRTIEAADWVSVMISKASFPSNIRICTQVKIGENGQGVGFLISAPENAERKTPYDGYCLWLGIEDSSGAFLFRNSIEVMHIPDLFLKKNEWHDILIEKIDHNIHCTIDGHHRFSYISHLPLAGTHIGILSQDGNYSIKPLNIFVGNLHLQVSCLAIPDAFLANNDYSKALIEYRRIAYSFPGHAEGREALFRAGITLLEEAKSYPNKKDTQLFNLALEEFAKLHQTPGAPLEYLGKALIYETLNESEEEIKCLEFALRRYKKHPLISVIKEQLIYRMHESSQRDRRSAFHLIYIALRHLPFIAQSSETRRLFKHLVSHWEILPFFDNPMDPFVLIESGEEDEKIYAYLSFAIPLAFWLGSPLALAEVYQEFLKLKKIEVSALGNCLFAIIELGSYSYAQKLIKNTIRDLKNLISSESQQELESILLFLEPIFICHCESLENGIKAFFELKIEDIGIKEFRTASYLMQYALRTEQESLVFTIADHLLNFPLSLEDQISVNAFRIWAYLAEKKWMQAEDLFRNYPLEMLNQETTLLHPLFGCWLYVEEGEEIASIHFAGVVDTLYPRSWALLSHQIAGNLIDNPIWIKNSFLWERRQLYRQLILFYKCIEDSEKELFYRHLERQEYIYVE